MEDYKKRRRKYDDDDYDDDDDRRYRSSRDRTPNKSAFERIITPGTATNNIIKTAATGVIAGGTILLMGIYGWFGDSLAGSQYLPMATAVSSAVATACVWIFGRPKAEEDRNREIYQLRRQLKDLNITLDEMELLVEDVDKRLGNVEVIENFEDRLAKKTLDETISSSLPKYEKEEKVAESSFMSPSQET